MTCFHAHNDPACSSYPARMKAAQEAKDEIIKEFLESRDKNKPDAEDYDIIDIVRFGTHIVVLKVRYPNCSKCAYEGDKVMVYLNVTETQIFKWRKIDPHFCSPEEAAARPPREAPGPNARFPASEDGWKDALAYAKRKFDGD